MLPARPADQAFPTEAWVFLQPAFLTYGLIAGVVSAVYRFRPSDRLWFYRFLTPAAVQCMVIYSFKTLLSMTGNEPFKVLLTVIIALLLVTGHYFLLEKAIWTVETKHTNFLAYCFYMSFLQVLLLPLVASYLDYSYSSLTYKVLAVSQLSLAGVSRT